MAVETAPFKSISILDVSAFTFPSSIISFKFFCKSILSKFTSFAETLCFIWASIAFSVSFGSVDKRRPSLASAVIPADKADNNAIDKITLFCLFIFLFALSKSFFNTHSLIRYIHLRHDDHEGILIAPPHKCRDMLHKPPAA